MRASFPTPTKGDTLKYCHDLWWFFHSASHDTGLISNSGHQLDQLASGTNAQHNQPSEPDINISAGKKLRKLFAQLRLLPEPDFGVLRVWYTQRMTPMSEIKVAAAHKAFYDARGHQ